MDKREAIELLKKALREMSHSRKILGNTQEFQLWHDRVSDIIEAAFGKSSLEYDRFISAVGAGMKVYDPGQETLDDCKTALKSIIKRYEILAVKTKSSTTAELPKAPEDYEGKAAISKDKPFGKTTELVLETNPEVLSSIIKTATSEFKLEDLHYKSIEESKSASPNFRKILITVIKIVDDSIASEDCIGIITLQSLGTDKTLFRIPPRNQWYINTEPRALPTLRFQSHVNKNGFNLLYDKSYFNHLLEKLDTEFTRLGFKKTMTQKIWRWLKSHKILSIIIFGIPLLAAIIYLIEYFTKLFGFSN